jgi:hypothetical protein
MAKKKTTIENAIESATLKKKEQKKVQQFESKIKYHQTRSGNFSMSKDKENHEKLKHEAETAVLLTRIHLIKFEAAKREDLL